MKKIFLRILVIVFFAGLFSCEEKDDFLFEEYSNHPPTIELASSSLSGQIGETVTISAHLEDDFILKWATLTSPLIGIDEYFQISNRGNFNDPVNDVIKSEEDLSYSFEIPSSAEPGNTYTVLLLVKNGTGQTSSAEINLNVN